MHFKGHRSFQGQDKCVSSYNLPVWKTGNLYHSPFQRFFTWPEIFTMHEGSGVSISVDVNQSYLSVFKCTFLKKIQLQ